MARNRMLRPIMPTPVFLFLLWCLLPLRLPAQEDRVLDLLWSPVGDRVAVALSKGSGGCELRVLSSGGQQQVFALEGPEVGLLGWTPAGDGVILDRGVTGLEIVRPDGGPRRLLPIPEQAVPVASDGERVYYIDPDDDQLVARAAGGARKVISALRPGTRPSGELSGDGRLVALRRSVRTGRGWATEIWVAAENQAPALAAVVGGPYVLLEWHPREPALLLSQPEAGLWSVQVVKLHERSWATLRRYQGLSSPGQWDWRGQVYFVDDAGLRTVTEDARTPMLHSWQGGARPQLWAVSPRGDRMASAGRAASSLRMIPLP